MAQSATGIGLGTSGKLTEKELSILANGINILVAGRIELEEGFLVNPPSPVATVTLANPLPGSYTNYVVLVTGLNTGAVYIASMSNDGGNFSEFSLVGESEGTCMYAIVKKGIRPKV
jgi:hypothetical protein